MTASVSIHVNNEPKVLSSAPAVPRTERINLYIERCRLGLAFDPAELRDAVELLCDDAFIAKLEPSVRDYVLNEFKPAVNAFLQRVGSKVRANRHRN